MVSVVLAWGSQEMTLIPLVPSMADAALMLRVTQRRLKEMQKAPWWKPEMQTGNGWDVVAIAVAQQAAETQKTMSRDDALQVLHHAASWSETMSELMGRYPDKVIPKVDPLDIDAVFAKFSSLVLSATAEH